MPTARRARPAPGRARASRQKAPGCCGGAVAAILLLASAAGLAQPLPDAAAAGGLVEIEVVGHRLGREASSVTLLSAADLQDAPSSRLDEILGQVPGLTLFRRATSRTAHPTIQGVSLRGLGPNGAGRTLVLVDGVPQNDPFGGWVYWNALSGLPLAGAAVVRGGSAVRWGSQALAGAIDLQTSGAEAGIAGEARLGSLGTVDGWGRVGVALGDARLMLDGAGFDSDGPFLLAPEQRGVVDVRAASRAWRLGGRLDAPLGTAVTATLRLARFEERRVNGIEGATNATGAWDVSLGLAGTAPVSWGLTLYYKDRQFRNRFVAVDAARASARPVLDQFDVPASGFGGHGFVGFTAGAHRFELGGDLRRNAGRTNERFRNLGAGFTRTRRAGGHQLIAGVYGDWSWQAGGTRLSAGARLDRWRLSDGQRLETDIATGAVLRDDAIARRSGWVATGRLGLRHRMTRALAFKAAAYTGFRLPTLNEYFRPFRVRNDITEANPNLDPERLYGIDVGLAIDGRAGAHLTLAYFRNWLRRAVANVTLAEGPGFFPPTGFVPPGGVLRQRRNIDTVLADGLEVAARLPLFGTRLTLGLGYLFVDARVSDGGDAAALTGKRVAQSPRHQLVLSATATPVERLRLHAEMRYGAAQFDDDLNRRRLGAYATVNMSLAYDLGARMQGFIEAWNLFDVRVQAALSGDGLITLAQPRTVSAGVRLRY